MKTLTFLIMLLLPSFFPFDGTAQFLTVTGTVKDHLSGKTITQISVLDKKSGIGTISSASGNYSLILRKGEVELYFSDEHHETFSAAFLLQNDTTINVALKPADAGAVKRSGKDQELLAGRNKLVASKGPGKK